MFEVDRRLWLAIGLVDATIRLLVNDVDMSKQPHTLVQMLAEKSLSTLLDWENIQTGRVDIARLRALLAPNPDIDPQS